MKRSGEESLAFAETIQALAGPAGASEPPAEAVVGVGRFEVVREIGRGGMGRVLEAKDAQFGRHVALKELTEARRSAEAVRRFVIESLVTGNLEHPGIPAVYERGVREGSPFYAMRRVRGRPLSEVIAERRELGERLLLLPAVVQVAHTLGFAHEHGVVHRDVKPDNVMLGTHGEVVLLDWGIAKVRDVAGSGLAAVVPDDNPAGAGATRDGSILGTPAYLSPEQAGGAIDKVDERTDVFALGGLLYHVLAGHPPYRGPTMASVVTDAVDARFEPIEAVAPDVPPELAAIVARAMARLPDDRYQSAGELARVLDGFLAGAVLSRPSRWLGLAVNAGSAMALLVLVVGIVLLWGIVPTFREQGAGALAGLIFLGIFGALAMVEWRTRGAHRLSWFLLALAGSTLVIGLVSTFLGWITTLRVALHTVPFDPRILLEGAYESSGNMISSGFSTAIQLLVWGMLKRIEPLSAPSGLARPGTISVARSRAPGSVSKSR